MNDNGDEYMVFCPDGNEILGTLERVDGRAEIASFFPAEDGSGWEYEHEGGTEIFYDSMATVQKDGEDLFLCTDGTEHKRSELSFRQMDPETGEYVAPTKELGIV